MKDTRQIAIKGIVSPVDWDDDGNITDIVIATPSEDEYLVQDGELKEELLALVGAEILVKGSLVSNKDGERVIAVQEYEQPEEDDQDLDDEDEDEEDWGFGDEGELEEEEFEYHEDRW